jgi:hypothetical protein
MLVKVQDNTVVQYPYSKEQLRSDNPNVSFPKPLTEETLAQFGVYPVGYQAAPEYDPLTQRLETSAQPVLIDGKWTLTKTVVAKTQEQIDTDTANKAAQVRQERNAKLSETDWRFRSDMTPSQGWIDYCQALRDVPQQEGFPFTITWPTKP